MANDFYEEMFTGLSGVTGDFFFASGTVLASGVGGDVSTDINAFTGVSGYQEITLTQNTNFIGTVDELVALYSGTDLGAFASGIYNDLMLGQMANTPFSVSYISGWLATHIGELNVQIETNFSTVSGFCSPALNYQQVAIYQEIFTAYYYKRMMNNLLGAGSYDWSTIVEADSRITKVTRNQIAQTYRTMINDTEARLKYLVGQYRQTAGMPVSVIGDDSIPFPFSDRYNYAYGQPFFPYYSSFWGYRGSPGC